MCLSSFYVPVRSSFVYYKRPCALFNRCRCGHCAECQQDLKSEYMYRTHYEAEDTFKKGGYVIFDTLTYSEDDCPWTKKVLKEYHNIDIPDNLNFRCFNYKDVTDFLKRVRTALDVQFPDCKENFKYILSSEYGTKNTKRPHYHIIFFIKNPKIEPVKFSLLISEKWRHGITDGVKDKGMSYFLNNRLFTDKNVGVYNSVGYVCKYIAKESDYSKVVKFKVSQLCKWLDSFERLHMHTNSDCYDYHLFILSLKRSINQFHKQSKGYGVSALESIDIDNVLDTGKVTMSDAYKVVRKISLPMYYYRKLFQQKEIDFVEFREADKVKHRLCEFWSFNKLGEEFKRRSVSRKIRSLESLYSSKLHSVLSLDSSDYEKNIASDIIKLLNGRSLNDFSKYCVLYKNRKLIGNGCIASLDYFINHMFDKGDKIILRTKRKEIEGYGFPHVVFNRSFCPDSDYIVSFDNFCRSFLCDDNINISFMNFDRICILFHQLDKYLNVRRQAAYDEKVRLRKKFSTINC